MGDARHVRRIAPRHLRPRRHLPVMDGVRVAGMISIGDLVKARLDAAEYENRYLREYIEAR